MCTSPASPCEVEQHDCPEIGLFAISIGFGAL